MIPALAALSAALYAYAGYCAWRRLPRLQGMVAGALTFHALALGLQLLHGGALRIGINEALSLFAWQSSLLLWVFCWREPVQINGVCIYPAAGLFALWAAAFPSPLSNISLNDWKVELHVLSSLLSAGLLTLAAVHAIALAVQDRMLHRHRFAPLNGRVPPLQTMERILFQLVGVGFVLLSLTLLSGLWFVHDWFAQHLAHKTMLSITAWVIFGVLIWGRWRYGWRGRKALRWVLSGYAMLIVAYFGSKLVLEQFLGLHWS